MKKDPKKKMSKWSVKVETRRVEDWGCYYREWLETSYRELSEEEYAKILKMIEKYTRKWEDILESGYISIGDALIVMEYAPYQPYGYRAAIQSDLEELGYFPRIDRNVYKNGAKFWTIDEMSKLPQYANLREEIALRIEKMKPAHYYFEGKLLKVYYSQYDLELFVTDVLNAKLEHNKEEKRKRTKQYYENEKAQEQMMGDAFDEAIESGIGLIGAFEKLMNDI